MKKTILYISPEYFSDVDFPVIEALRECYNIHWVIVFSALNAKKPKYSVNEIQSFAKKWDINCEILIRKFRLRNPLNILITLKLLKIIRKCKADVVYIETLSDLYSSLPWFFLNKKRAILAIHNVIDHSVAKRTITDQMINLGDRIERKYAYNIHVFSNSQRDILKQNYLAKRVFVAPLFLKKVFGVNELPAIENATFNFLFWGTLRYNKGLNFLILAAEQLYNNGVRNFKVIIAGRSTEEWELCKSLITHQSIFELYVSNEFIPIEQVPVLFAKSKFLVLPYRDVTQSGPLLYAYNYNLPVIAADLPGFKEYIVNGENGFLFEAGNVDALRSLMQSLLELSAEELFAVKNKLSEFVEKNVSETRIADKYISMFETVISSANNQN